jgi:hypothetical protein
MVAHGPPYGILDLVQRERRCGCDAFAQALSQHKAPSLCVFGHVHAQQSDGECGPRLCVSRRHPGTLFANAASETGIPDITGYRLIEGTGRYDDVAMLRPPTVLDIPVHGFKEAPDQPVAPKRKYWRDPNDPAPPEPVRWVRPKRRTYPELAEAEDSPAKRPRVDDDGSDEGV